MQKYYKYERTNHNYIKFRWYAEEYYDSFDKKCLIRYLLVSHHDENYQWVVFLIAI